MIFHLFRLATLAKGALALSLVAGAYGAGSADVQEYRVRTTSVRVEATHEPTPKPLASAKPEPKNDAEDSEKSARSSFEALLKECVGRYSRAAENTKEACERAMAASGLDRDAFWAKYRYLLVPAALKTDRPATSPKPATSSLKPSTTDAAVKECLARYETLKTLKTGPAEAFEAALRAFNEKCRSRLAAKLQTTEPKKPATAPTSSPKPTSTDPAVKECLARYETLKALKTGPADAFEAAMRTLNETCRSLLTAKLQTTEPQKPVTKPTSSPKPASTDPVVKDCLARYEMLKTLKTGPAAAFEAALGAFNETCKRVLEARR